MKPKMLIIDDEVENVNIFNLQYSNKWDVVGILTPHDLLKKATFIQESQPVHPPITHHPTLFPMKTNFRETSSVLRMAIPLW